MQEFGNNCAAQMLIVNILDLANTIVCVTKVILGMENNVNVSNILSFSIRSKKHNNKLEPTYVLINISYTNSCL